MAHSDHHIIQKQTIQLECWGVDGQEVQQKVLDAFYEYLAPKLSERLDLLFGDDKLVQVPQLKIDLGAIDPNDLEESFARAGVKAIEEALQQLMVNPPPHFHKSTRQAGIFEIWIHFLRAGSLPWNGSKQSLPGNTNELLEFLATDLSAPEALQKVLKSDPVAVARLVLQHQRDFLQSVIAILTAQNQARLLDFLRELLEYWQELPLTNRQSLTSKKWFGTNSSQAIEQEFWALVFTQVAAQGGNQTWNHLASGFLKRFASGINHLRLAAKGEGLSRMENRYPHLLEILEEIEPGFKLGQTESLTQSIPKRREEEPSSPSTKGELVDRTDDVDQDEMPGKSMPSNRPHATHDVHSEEEKSEIKGKLGRSNIEAADSSIETPPVDAKASAALKDGDEEPIKEVTGDALDEPEDNAIDTTNREIDAGSKPDDAVDEHKKRLAHHQSQTDDRESDQSSLNAFTPDSSKVEKGLEPNISQEDDPGAHLKSFEQLIEQVNQAAPEVGAEHYVDNAGMVILHPYLPIYFKAVNLLDGKDFIDEATRQRAIYLLEFLATGEAGVPEYRLTLPKLLCNWPLEMPLNQQFELTEEERDEGEQLIKAVIKNWPVMQNTTVEGLREGFLSRPGKLEYRSNGWYLMVEQRTIDILLDKLPWGLSMIKLPWMSDFLRVEWN